jgi:thioredoxin reductase (NADPH)
MSAEQGTITVYGTTWCPDCKRSKKFLGDQRIHYVWVDIEKDSEAMAYVEKINQGARSIPTIVFPDGEILVEPSNAELAQQLGISTQAEHTYYDVVIVGAGPAGLTAAIYTAREGLETLVIEKSAPGGQTGITQMIDNFPGFDQGITGEKFADRLTNQAERFGVEILQAQAVTQIRTKGRYKEVLTSDGSCYAGKAILIASGARYRLLDVPGEDELIGIKIHFCATCDGAFYKDKNVMVIGGGNSAFEESLFLNRYANEVTILTRDQEVKASRTLQEKVDRIDAISVVTGHQVEEFKLEDGNLGAVITRDLAANINEVWQPDGVFIFIGRTPNTNFLLPEIEVERHGFVVTDKTLQTSKKGIFAAGDVRSGATAQAASAAGEGATAALMIRQYLESIGEE